FIVVLLFYCKNAINMRYIAPWLLISLPFLTIGQQNQAQHYKIYSTSQQKVVSVDDVLASLDKADVLFFGEEHNDSTCHVLEYLLFKGIAQKYPGKTALSMEMFETDCQEVLNEYLDSLVR